MHRWTSKNHDALISSKDFHTNQPPWSPQVHLVRMSHSFVPSACRRWVLSGSITCLHISETVTHLHCRDCMHLCLLFPDQNEQALKRFGLNNMPRSRRKKEPLNQKIHSLFLKLIALDESFQTSQYILQIQTGGLSCLFHHIK